MGWPHTPPGHFPRKQGGGGIDAGASVDVSPKLRDSGPPAHPRRRAGAGGCRREQPFRGNSHFSPRAGTAVSVARLRRRGGDSSACRGIRGLPPHGWEGAP
eukprot:scaffold20309_cov51-Isochrysis_galbana.AAC.1